VPVERGTRNHTPELPLQDAIDRFVRAERLFLFKATARANKSLCFFRGWPGPSGGGDTIPALLRLQPRHWRRKVRTETRRADRWAAGVPLG